MTQKNDYGWLAIGTLAIVGIVSMTADDLCNRIIEKALDLPAAMYFAGAAMLILVASSIMIVCKWGDK